jgi:acetyl-CoA carboxylase biotin carboxyl carrier protein
MDYKQIQELIKIINRSNIGELSIEEKDFKITIKQKKEKAQTFVTAPSTSQPIAAVPQVTMAQPPITMQSAEPVQKTPTADATAGLITIKSPMIGTFYRRASPDKPLYVEVGSEIEPGKVICIIEAMKLFNEIESDISGKIVKILVDDSSPVEYDQPLFLVEPA